MSYGITNVAKAASERITQLDTISNNLANSSTPGFKMDNFYPGAPDKTTAKEGPVSALSRSIADLSQGMFQETGNPLDLAIEGEGFFSIQTKTGTQYTRKGSFSLNANNQIVTSSGELVMGEKGPVTVAAKGFYLDGAANVIVNGAKVDRLNIVTFKNPEALSRTKEGMFSDPGRAGLEKVAVPKVKVGTVEMSNVNVFKEMVEMIDVQRSFESYQKIIQTMADMDKIAVSRVGRLA